jgi:hypothetical protein
VSRNPSAELPVPTRLVLALVQASAGLGPGSTGHRSPRVLLTPCDGYGQGVAQVVEMHYRVRWLDDVRLAQGAPPLAVDLAGFECRLDGDTLTAKPRSQYPTVEDARTVLDPALHAWEAHCELDLGHRFSFTYSGCTIGDLLSPKQRAMAISDLMAMTDHLQVSKVLGEFPPPDPSLVTESDFAYELRLRWRAQRDGRERLLSAGYAILTAIEQRNGGGNRGKAAGQIAVSQPLLNRLGELTAREDPQHGRAYGKHGAARRGSLSQDEIRWLEAVIPRLLRRVMERDAGQQNLQELTLAHFPAAGSHN